MHHGRGIERFGAVRGFRSVTAVLRRLSDFARASWRFLKSSSGCFAYGAVITAPPKPSVQTQIILGRMEEHIQAEDTHWDQVMESLDLLFARVTDIGRDQQQIRAQLGHHTEVLQGYGQAQEALTHKVDATSQAVAQLTPDSISFEPARPPPSSHQGPSGETGYHRPPFQSGRLHQDHSNGRNYIPKLSFPRFDGHHPKIWRDKCMDYFHICNVPEYMWVTTASLHLDDNAAQWLPT